MAKVKIWRRKKYTYYLIYIESCVRKEITGIEIRIPQGVRKMAFEEVEERKRYAEMQSSDR